MRTTTKAWLPLAPELWGLSLVFSWQAKPVFPNMAVETSPVLPGQPGRRHLSHTQLSSCPTGTVAHTCVLPPSPEGSRQEVWLGGQHRADRGWLSSSSSVLTPSNKWLLPGPGSAPPLPPVCACGGLPPYRQAQKAQPSPAFASPSLPEAFHLRLGNLGRDAGQEGDRAYS